MCEGLNTNEPCSLKKSNPVAQATGSYIDSEGFDEISMQNDVTIQREMFPLSKSVLLPDEKIAKHML